MKIITRTGLSLSVDPRTGHAKKATDESTPHARQAIYLPYRSKWENTFAAHLRQLLAAGQITWWAYEPVTLKLARGLRYTPDFMAAHVQEEKTDARLVFYEVKGWSKNRREGIAKLKIAAQVCPWASFVLVTYHRGKMECTTIPQGGTYDPSRHATSERPPSATR